MPAVVRVAALTDDFKQAIDKFVDENKIVLFMKGTKQFPQCGFSNTTVQILNTFQVPYETVRWRTSRQPESR
jgi:monothiol glutaredoxin